MLSGCGSHTAKQVELRDQGIELMAQGDYEGAIKLFDEGLHLSLGSVKEMEIDLCYYKAAAQYAAGQFNDAVATYSALIRYDKDNYAPYFMRGSIYANEGEIGDACKDYDKACELKKDYELYLEIFDNLDALGYRTQAMKYLDEALEVKDNSANGYMYRGQIYYKMGMYEQSMAELNESVKKGCEKAKVYLAKIYEYNGDSATATELLTEYASSDEVTSEALGTLGDLEMASGNYSTALSYYQAGQRLDQVDNMQQLLKGEIAALESMLRFDEAETKMEEYLALYPADTEASRELLFLSTR